MTWQIKQNSQFQDFLYFELHTRMCTVHLELPLSCPILTTLDHTFVCKDQRVCQ